MLILSIPTTYSGIGRDSTFSEILKKENKSTIHVFGEDEKLYVQCQNIELELNEFGYIIIDPNSLLDLNLIQENFTTISIIPSTFDNSNIGVTPVALSVSNSFGNLASCISLVSIRKIDQPLVSGDVDPEFIHETPSSYLGNRNIHLGVGDMVAFPNPIARLSNRVNVEYNGFTPGSVNIQLLDVSGRILETKSSEVEIGVNKAFYEHWNPF